MFIDNTIIVASWPKDPKVAQNWGDKLNRELIHKLSRQPVVHEKDVTGWADRPVYRVIGSGLGSSNKNHVVWGMGFLDQSSEMKDRPALICAVRGPLSRSRLINYGIECPPIYGDPAIIYPIFYRPKLNVQYDFGIIQHFREFGIVNPVKIPRGKSSIEINICSGINDVVDKIISCRTIISSSLHGLICAHAYGIAAHWLKASDLPLGDDFKFYDYYASIGHETVEPASSDKRGYFKAGGNPSLPERTLIKFETLISSCPFISPSRKSDILKTYYKQKTKGNSGLIFNL